MKIKAKDYRAKPGEDIDLSTLPTRVELGADKAECDALIRRHAKALDHLQEKLYASRAYALLVILQGMDAAGKDGVIGHVMAWINPQGCQVTSFKEPTKTEDLHDFLWRAAIALPARGMIGIFNRSYYEEVLVVRIHAENLEAEGEDPKAADHKHFWNDRFRSIVDFEAHLHRNRTRAVKIFLHLSREEQRRRFLERIDQPEKNWKLTLADIAERALWKRYQHAYEACIAGSGTKHCPWHVVPADDKQIARLIVSQIILEAMEDMDLAFPQSSEAHVRELEAVRAKLAE